jgi:hypothetical protein
MNRTEFTSALSGIVRKGIVFIATATLLGGCQTAVTQNSGISLPGGGGVSIPGGGSSGGGSSGGE